MIEASQIAEARAEARAAAGIRRLVDVLEEKLGLAPDEFAERLAATFRYDVLRMEEFRRLEPAFRRRGAAALIGRAAAGTAPRASERR